MTKNEQIIAELRSLVIQPRFVDGLPTKQRKKMDLHDLLILAEKVSRNLDDADKVIGAH